MEAIAPPISIRLCNCYRRVRYTSLIPVPECCALFLDILTEQGECLRDEYELLSVFKSRDKLDGISGAQGLPQFSAFFDPIELTYDFSHVSLTEVEDADGIEYVDEKGQLDKVTGSPYTLDDMTWYDLDGGLKVLDELASHDWRHRMKDEFAYLCRTLGMHRGKGARFHFLMIKGS